MLNKDDIKSILNSQILSALNKYKMNMMWFILSKMGALIDRLLKTRYTTVPEDIPIFRGVLHLLFAPFFLSWSSQWLAWPSFTLLVGLGYLISFIYHRINWLESFFRFLDHLLILLRIVIFPQTLLPFLLLIIPVLGYIPVYLNRFGINRYYQWFHRYFIISAIVMIIYIISIDQTHIMWVGAVFAPAGIWFAIKPKMRWHKYSIGKVKYLIKYTRKESIENGYSVKRFIWGYHEDFHLLLLLADLLLVIIGSQFL